EEKSFGRWVKDRRTALDLTRKELGAHIGCSQHTIYKIETGERRPSKQLLTLLLKALSTPPADRADVISTARRSGKPTLESDDEPWLNTLLEDATSTAPSASVGVATGPTNLPSQATSLIGRDSEILLICLMLQQPAIRL